MPEHLAVSVSNVVPSLGMEYTLLSLNHLYGEARALKLKFWWDLESDWEVFVLACMVLICLWAGCRVQTIGDLISLTTLTSDSSKEATFGRS